MTEARPLTQAQSLQLRQLLDANALDRDSAKGPWDLELARCNPMVLGRLREFGLADSRTVKPRGGSQFTAYWLTKEGAAAARKMASERGAT